MSGWIAAVAAGALSWMAGGQGLPPVRVACCLPGEGTERARELVQAAVSDLEVEVAEVEPSDLLVALRSGAAPADLLLGLDGFWALSLADEGRLAVYASPGAASLAPSSSRLISAFMRSGSASPAGV